MTKQQSSASLGVTAAWTTVALAAVAAVVSLGVVQSFFGGSPSSEPCKAAREMSGEEATENGEDTGESREESSSSTQSAEESAAANTVSQASGEESREEETPKATTPAPPPSSPSTPSKSARGKKWRDRLSAKKQLKLQQHQKHRNSSLEEPRSSSE